MSRWPCRKPAFPRRPTLAGLLALILLLGAGLAGATVSLEQWRADAGRLRILADNDATGAYQQALRLQQDLPTDANAADQARVLNLLARIELYAAATDAAANHARQALELSRQNNDHLGRAEAQLNIAINSVNQADVASLTSAPSKALEHLDGNAPADLRCEALLRQAMLFRRQGQIEESVAMSVQTMEIAQRDQSPRAMTYAHQGLAITYDQSNRPAEALNHYAQMRDWAKKIPSKLLEADALLGMAGADVQLGNVAASDSALQQAIAHYQAVGAPFSIARAAFTLADNLRNRHRPAEALPHFDRVLADYRRYPNKIGTWWTLMGRSATYQALNRLSAAHADAEAMQVLAQEIGLPIYLAQSAQRLAAVYAAQGKHRQAYEQSTAAAEITARMTRDKAGSQLVERYQKESRQREIDQLTRSNERQLARQRWLATVLLASIALLAVSGVLLFRLRRSHRQQEALNTQLQRSRNKLQATLDAIPDPLFELGLDGRYYSCHSSRPELLVAPTTEMIGRTICEVLPPDAAACNLEALHEAHAKGTSSGRQFALALPQGITWFELSVARKSMVAGEQPRFIVLSRNITRRKRLEAREETRLRTFELLAHGGKLDDILHKVVSYVEHERPALLCSIMLLDADGKRLRSAVGPRLPADYLAAIDGIVIGPGAGSCGTSAWRGETVVVEDVDSHPYWESCKQLPLAAGLRACWSEPIIGSAGTVLGTFAIYLRQPGGPTGRELDLARQASHLAAVAIEKTRMAAALATSEREFRTLAENSPDNISRYDRHCQLLYMNPRLEATLGLKLADALGKTSQQAKPHAHVADYQAKLAAVIASGQPDELEIVLPDTGEGPRFHQIRMVAERGAQAEIVGVLAIGRDITELKMNARQIEESRDLLRELAARRDSAREEERKRIAREIHDELGQMLTAQRLDIATLKFQFGDNNPRLAERCDHLIQVADQTLQVVRNVATSLRPASLDMGARAAMEWLATEFRQRTGVACQLHFGADEVSLDEAQSVGMFRIVQESLTNVVRYAAAQQVDIALAPAGDEQHLLLSIRDDGRGFDPESVGGKSFGLVGIRERALMLGGEARFVSAPGRGTAVEIKFPHHRCTKVPS